MDNCKNIQVAFEEIPQRELRDEEVKPPACVLKDGCIRRNPTKGIESGGRVAAFRRRAWRPVAFEEIPQRELRAISNILSKSSPYPVAFEEIPQRELRVCNCCQSSAHFHTFRCIRRNPTKGIESGSRIFQPLNGL